MLPLTRQQQEFILTKDDLKNFAQFITLQFITNHNQFSKRHHKVLPVHG
jgi:hypothetical protein